MHRNQNIFFSPFSPLRLGYEYFFLGSGKTLKYFPQEGFSSQWPEKGKACSLFILIFIHLKYIKNMTSACQTPKAYTISNIFPLFNVSFLSTKSLLIFWVSKECLQFPSFQKNIFKILNVSFVWIHLPLLRSMVFWLVVLEFYLFQNTA